MNVNPSIQSISIDYPKHFVFGSGSLMQMANELMSKSTKRVFILATSALEELLFPVTRLLNSEGIQTKLNFDIKVEPTFSNVEAILHEARAFECDAIAGIGGGSVMDVAKVVAALLDGQQKLSEVVGKNLIQSRNTLLICMPTTSGTGSEVSPNSILMDDSDGGKKGIISPFLVPDMVYVDPELTLGLPAEVTAYTGIDAFTHCLEAFTNVHAHPIIDTIALEGMRLIAGNLKKAVYDGKNLEARTNMALGSVYGGMCLGPVNTAAIHALAYPLGSEYKIAHGLSNALMMKSVMEYNMPMVYDKYARVAEVIGVNGGGTKEEMAYKGLEYIKELMEICGMTYGLSALGINRDEIPLLAQSALKIQRLLVNNPRPIELADAINIYENAF